MKCKICGGNLLFNNGIYVCKSCGSKQSISDYKEYDVYISYIESDVQGRRTKDSIIAEEIYNALENSGIKTFYQRKCAENIIGEEAEKLCGEISSSVKIILMIGTTKDNFDTLINNHIGKFGDKIILPIWADINPYDIPKQIQKFQALDYNKLGATNDLKNNILNALGRGEEIDYVSHFEKRMKRRKKIVACILFTVALMIVSIASYIIFATPLVLKSKKLDVGQKYYEAGEYIEAIKMLTEIKDYKNTKDLLNNIYSKYEGYYFNKSKNIKFHLNITNEMQAQIEIKCINDDGEIIKITENAEVTGNLITFDFVDSENNNGAGNIYLLNDKIKVAIKVSEQLDKVSAGNVDVTFDITEKEDAEYTPEINKNTLLLWLEQKITKKEIVRQGYELEYLNYWSHSSEITNYNIYKIANTDIAICFNEENESDSIIDFVTAPYKLIMPKMIGNEVRPVFEDGIIYYGNYEYDVRVSSRISANDETSSIIDVDSIAMMIPSYCIEASPFYLGKFNDEIISDFLDRYGYEYEFNNNINNTIREFAENEKYIISIIYINDDYGDEYCVVYRIDKEELNFEYLDVISENVLSKNSDEARDQMLDWFGD